jgi:hypothetical protein
MERYLDLLSHLSTVFMAISVIGLLVGLLNKKVRRLPVIRRIVEWIGNVDTNEGKSKTDHPVKEKSKQ